MIRSIQYGQILLNADLMYGTGYYIKLQITPKSRYHDFVCLLSIQGRKTSRYSRQARVSCLAYTHELSLCHVVGPICVTTGTA